MREIEIFKGDLCVHASIEVEVSACVHRGRGECARAVSV
jgi:hypothetical protein